MYRHVWGSAWNDMVGLLRGSGGCRVLARQRDPAIRLLHQRRPKYVATSTPLEREWTNSHVIDGGLVDFVSHLKGQPGGDIGVHGSISVTRTLLAADILDELRLVIAPTIAASGQRLFDGLPPIRLETIRGNATPSGHLLVDYRVVR